MFYNKEVKLYELKQQENEHGAVVEERYVHVKSLMVDIQPYSQEKLNKEYGYDLKATKRMFCDLENTLNESTVIEYRNKFYKIVKIIDWDDYLDIALDDAVGVDLSV